MSEIPLLWGAGSRKEALDLLCTLWSNSGGDVRDRLSDVLVAGPPEELLEHLPPGEREKSRDRRVFDRIAALERIGVPPLNEALQVELARIIAEYPNWRLPEGEQAHFGSWTEVRSGPDTRHNINDLKLLSDQDLADVLLNERDMREGLLDAWRQFASSQPERAIALLYQINAQLEHPPGDIVFHGIRGLRDAAKQPTTRKDVLSLMQDFPAMLDRSDVSSAMADFLEVAASAQSSATNDTSFWNVFDRTLAAAQLDPQNGEVADDHDWVFLAINRSIGTLATAFFSALFARELRVGTSIPSDLRPRLEALLRRDAPSHLLARVIAASRLSYLFAVDPDWTQENLLPSFDWEASELEAVAVWQGYAWQPRIDEKLWRAIKPYFIHIFTRHRLLQLGEMGNYLGQILMLVGIEFGIDQIPRDAARNAIRAMPDEMRSAAVSWAASYLEQAKEDSGQPESDPANPSRHPDVLWKQKVAPWLDRVWPAEPDLRSQSTAEQFALAAIATDKRFPDAVGALMPHFLVCRANETLHSLAASRHPENHPRAVLNLIDALVDPDARRFGAMDLQNILDRLSAADPQIVHTAAFRTWHERLRAQQ